VTFKKAVKHESKGRVALIGPAGSGKSYTMLKLARALAGPTGKIAAVDTEHGSLSKYADLFDFDVIELDSYSPTNFLDSLKAAEDSGYSVFCCDSLSHFWMGRDGALEFVDTARKRSQSKDDMSGWKEFRPHERSMVDAMIASPCHVVVTMRTKTAYEEQVNERTGKKQRIKIGLAPVQREGLEYEMDLVGAMDEENNLVIDKTRCPHYAGKAISKPGEKEFAPFIEWLKGAARQSQAPPTTPEPESQAVLALFEKCKKNGSWDKFSFAATGAALKKDIIELVGNESVYYGVIGRHGFKHFGPDDMNGIKPRKLCDVIRDLYQTLENARREPTMTDEERKAMEIGV
jgi:hypothetical protein